MSGGHFNYNQYEIRNIADEIEIIVEKNDNTEKDEYGDDVGYHFNSEIIDKFNLAVHNLRRVEVMVQRIDWLISGDDSEETFLRRWSEEVMEKVI